MKFATIGILSVLISGSFYCFISMQIVLQIKVPDHCDEILSASFDATCTYEYTQLLSIIITWGCIAPLLICISINTSMQYKIVRRYKQDVMEDRAQILTILQKALLGSMADLMQIRDYLTLFEAHHVRFNDLKALTNQDLKDIGINSWGQRKKVLEVIRKSVE